MADRIKTMIMDRENIWGEFDELTSDWDDQDMDDDLDEDEFEDDRDMDLDDDLFPDSRRVQFEDLDMDQSRRIPGVTFEGEPLTEDLCDEYEHDRPRHPCEITFTPWSEIKIQPRIKHRATVKVSRFSILFEDVATAGREVKIKTMRWARKPEHTTEKHKAVCRTLDACARTMTQPSFPILSLARSLGILHKNQGRRWTYDRWTNTITSAPKFTFHRLPSPRFPAWVRPLPCPPVATDEVLTVPVNLRVLDPALAKNVRLALRLFGRYVLPTRACHGRCVGGSCLCPWMPTLERFVDRDPREQARDEYERTFFDRLKYAPKVLVSAHEMRVTLPRYETSAEAKYLTLRRSDRGEFCSIQYGEALAPFEYEGKQGQIGDRVALWHYGRGQTTIAARTPVKDVPKVKIARRTAQGKRKVPHRPAHARTPARPRTGPAKSVLGHAPGLGPERAWSCARSIPGA